MVIKSVCNFLLLRIHGKGNGNLGFPFSFFHKSFFFGGWGGEGFVSFYKFWVLKQGIKYLVLE